MFFSLFIKAVIMVLYSLIICFRNYKLVIGGQKRFYMSLAYDIMMKKLE